MTETMINSYPITAPNTATFHKDYSQLAQIKAPNGEFINVYWRSTMREIGIQFRDQFIAQSDNTRIVDTLAHLIGISSYAYMLRFNDVVYLHKASVDSKPSAEKVGFPYRDTWSYFATNGTCLQFTGAIDQNAETFPNPPYDV